MLAELGALIRRETRQSLYSTKPFTVLQVRRSRHNLEASLPMSACLGSLLGYVRQRGQRGIYSTSFTMWP